MPLPNRFDSRGASWHDSASLSTLEQDGISYSTRLQRSCSPKPATEESHATIVNDMLGWLSAKTHAETMSWSKIIVDKATNRIFGAHFVGHEGQELVNVFGLAVEFGITAHQLRDQVCAYPTFSADIKHTLGHA
jgi:hypothetical protein